MAPPSQKVTARISPFMSRSSFPALMPIQHNTEHQIAEPNMV